MDARTKLLVILSVPLTAGVLGVVASSYAKRMRMSGRISLALLCVPLVSYLAMASADEEATISAALYAALLFFSIPVCLMYAYHARRHAPDHKTALAGFAGALLFSLGYLIAVPMFAYVLFRVITGKEL